MKASEICKTVVDCDRLRDILRQNEHEIKCLVEIPCATCIHQDVCSFKETYTKILNSISNAAVEQPCDDEQKTQYKKVTDFDFINNISVGCCYYKNWTIGYRDKGE